MKKIASVFALLITVGLLLAVNAGATDPATSAGTTQAKVEQAASAPTSEAEKVPAYITQKPTDGVYRIVVLGDSLADGLYQGLTQINKDDARLVTTKKSKVNTGLVRVDRYDWNKGAKQVAQSGEFQIAVVLLGLNDLQSFRENGKAYHYQTDGWVERYRGKVEAMMGDLKTAGLAVYWVGIPITAPNRYQKDYEYLNRFYTEAAAKIGVRYIDTWNALADDKGAFTPYWKDKDGKQQEIRNRDGVHFTPDGYQIFAGFVNNSIRSDLEGLLEQPAKQAADVPEGESD